MSERRRRRERLATADVEPVVYVRVPLSPAERDAVELMGRLIGQTPERAGRSAFWHLAKHLGMSLPTWFFGDRIECEPADATDEVDIDGATKKQA